MAVIDRRLLPLIEVLAESGADWLAFELFDGLRVGRAPEDSDEELSRARLAIRKFIRDERLPEEEKVGYQAAVPIVGDEQIAWAANYVTDRISESVGMLEASLSQLESIVVQGRDSGMVPDIASTQIEDGLAIRIEGEQISIHRTELQQGIGALSVLREALDHWSESVRTGGDAS
jgi:hypothetical protein